MASRQVLEETYKTLIKHEQRSGVIKPHEYQKASKQLHQMTDDELKTNVDFHKRIVYGEPTKPYTHARKHMPELTQGERLGLNIVYGNVNKNPTITNTRFEDPTSPILEQTEAEAIGTGLITKKKVAQASSSFINKNDKGEGRTILIHGPPKKEKKSKLKEVVVEEYEDLPIEEILKNRIPSPEIKNIAEEINRDFEKMDRGTVIGLLNTLKSAADPIFGRVNKKTNPDMDKYKELRDFVDRNKQTTSSQPSLSSPSVPQIDPNIKGGLKLIALFYGAHYAQVLTPYVLAAVAAGGTAVGAKMLLDHFKNKEIPKDITNDIKIHQVDKKNLDKLNNINPQIIHTKSTPIQEPKKSMLVDHIKPSKHQMNPLIQSSQPIFKPSKHETTELMQSFKYANSPLYRMREREGAFAYEPIIKPSKHETTELIDQMEPKKTMPKKITPEVIQNSKLPTVKQYQKEMKYVGLPEKSHANPGSFVGGSLSSYEHAYEHHFIPKKEKQAKDIMEHNIRSMAIRQKTKLDEEAEERLRRKKMKEQHLLMKSKMM